MITRWTRPMAAELHVLHCDARDRAEPDHVCQGVITINAKTCTFDCARCGTDVVNIAQDAEWVRMRLAEEWL